MRPSNGSARGLIILRSSSRLFLQSLHGIEPRAKLEDFARGQATVSFNRCGELSTLNFTFRRGQATVSIGH
jgi:hypothetical protein